MGDAFTQAQEKKDNNARITKLEIAQEYINLIDQSDEDTRRSARRLRGEKGCRRWCHKTCLRLGYADETDQDKKEARKEMKKALAQQAQGNSLILYVVKPDEALSDLKTWEGQMGAMKKATDKIVTKNFEKLNKKLNKLGERMVLSETNEDRQEREVAIQINNLSESQSYLKGEMMHMSGQISKLTKLVKTIVGKD